MSSDEIAISVRGLGKSYRISHRQQHSTMAESMLHRLKNPFTPRPSEVMWALRDLDFDIARGEIVGLLGRNGAGKSTLLKVLSRITEPTTGTARLSGRVGSLIEVGTGFQPELTGRENIYLNGTILGMRRREVAKRFDEIVDFSGVERFLDTPVKHYSSGMYVRLAFAVAAHLDTDILFVDEVLSVGDAEFQKKSLGKMDEVANSGRTIIFVSHSVAAIETLCSRGLFFQGGRLAHAGPIGETLAIYHNVIKPEQNGARPQPVEITDREYFRSLDLVDQSGESTRVIPMGTSLRLKIGAEFAQQVHNPLFIVFIEDAAGQIMLNLASPKSERALGALSGLLEINCVIEHLPLPPGDYSIWLRLFADPEGSDQTDRILSFVVREADTFNDGWGARKALCVAGSHWSLTDSLDADATNLSVHSAP